MDHDTYFLNLTETNIKNKAVWEKEYSARSDLNLTDLSPQSWNEYINRMAADPNVFQSFYGSV